MTTYGRPRLPDPGGSRRARKAAYLLRQATRLQRGEQLRNHGDHHAAMALVKAAMGDPRPTVCPSCGEEKKTTLSLAAFSDSTYVGYSTNSRAEYWLSTDPNDYVWECHRCNMHRGQPTRLRRAA